MSIMFRSSNLPLKPRKTFKHEPPTGRKEQLSGRVTTGHPPQDASDMLNELEFDDKGGPFSHGNPAAKRQVFCIGFLGIPKAYLFRRYFLFSKNIKIIKIIEVFFFWGHFTKTTLMSSRLTSWSISLIVLLCRTEKACTG